MKKTIISLFVMALAAACSPGQKVTLVEDDQTYTMDNGIVEAVVAKASGDLVSLKYGGVEMLATFLDENGNPDLQKDPPGANPNGLNRGMTDHQYGFWSHDAMGPKDSGDAIATVTIDPKKNGGKRAEVSVKGISEGRLMGTGPGASPFGQFASDIEIRFAMEKGLSGVYTYCYFVHPESYPATQIGEARFCAKLAPTFDWITADKSVDFHYPKDFFAGDKYVYTANLTDNPVFGWSSTVDSIGCYLINPSMEYMSGGPTKVEFMGHRDTNSEAAGCILNYWRSSHYGGAEVTVAEGERWEKVIGPFLLYVNSGSDHTGLYKDARAEAAKQQAMWPFNWVKGVDYPSAKQRAEVRGKFVIDDIAAPASFENCHVGLTASDGIRFGWQRDAKNYQFWTLASSDGQFVIPAVRAGKYTLVAFTDGVLGEYSKADVVVEEGKALDLGELVWTPVRYGAQLFEIGVANRTGSEFYGAAMHRDPEVVLKYPSMFPDDIVFEVGKSDWSKDWFYMQVPHNEDPEAKVLPFFGIRSAGRDTPYTVVFNVDEMPTSASAVLRLALCGTCSMNLKLSVNDTDLGVWMLTQTGDGVITRHGSHGIWHEDQFKFDASLLKQGENKIVITVPGGSLNSGIVYDYLRLECCD